MFFTIICRICIKLYEGLRKNRVWSAGNILDNLFNLTITVLIMNSAKSI